LILLTVPIATAFSATGPGYPDPRLRPEWRKRYTRLLPFDQARKTVRSIGFVDKEEWDEWVAEGKSNPWLGPYMPSRPDLMYEDDWRGWDDFLGVILAFESARAVVHQLGVADQEAWWRLVRERSELLADLRVPAWPHLKYRSQWAGYDDWLGLDAEPLFPPPATTRTQLDVEEDTASGTPLGDELDCEGGDDADVAGDD